MSGPAFDVVTPDLIVELKRAAIKIRRSIISNKRFAPKGYIFYEIKEGYYAGSKLIDLERENAIGQAQIESNIRDQILEATPNICYGL